MKKKILDILEKHYHGRNFIESRCADDLLGLFSVVEQSEQCDHDYQPCKHTAVSEFDKCTKCGKII